MKALMLSLLAFSVAAVAAPVEKLTAFELSDQHEKLRSYRFPKSKVTVMTIADHKGSDELEPWVQRLYNRYGKRIDIDGIANVSMIPAPFQGMFRRAFKKELTYSVMLDWGGSVVRQFGYNEGVVNLYVVDRCGRIVKRLSGAVSDDAFRELTREIDCAIADTSRSELSEP
jgi:hypothetical protein